MKDAQATASSKFDEHERDTAKRAYPKELAEGAQNTEANATRRIPKMDLEAVLRNESGTRRAVSREEIERFTQAQTTRASGNVPVAGADEIDAHSRPTIDATPPFLGFEQGAGRVDRATLEHLQQPTREPARETVPLVVDRLSPVRESGARPVPAKRTSRWHLSLVVVTVIALCATWTTIGFLLGRYLPH